MSRGIIVVDAGHGQFGNQHTTKEGFYEGTQNYILACFLKEELEKLGFTVLLTREKAEDNPELEARGKLAGENGAIMFLSIHSNAPGASATPERYSRIRGAETYYSVTDEEKNARIAEMLNAAVVKEMNTEDRGIKTRRHPDNEELDYYSVIRNAVLSGCHQAFLIEHGFHTNPEDSAFLQDSDCLKRLAIAEAAVIDKVFI